MGVDGTYIVGNGRADITSAHFLLPGTQHHDQCNYKRGWIIESGCVTGRRKEHGF